jgi:electron transport complex protein RnfB
MSTVTALDIDAVLPQTQCRRCGFEGCLPYAHAIVDKNIPINRCPPGGEFVIEQLARLTQRPIIPLDPQVGNIEPPTTALIDAESCIGCAKCLPACPVDAILGARKALHQVIEKECTGCGLCLPPCPVDCITLVPTGKPVLTANEITENADRNRKKYQKHQVRIEQRKLMKQSRFAHLGDGL